MAKSLRMPVAALAVALLSGAAARAEKVGEVGVDWIGNDIVIEALQDPEIEGVTCHLTYFERGIIDRLQKGNWFEDPSNSSIACRQTGPLRIGDIDMSQAGEEVFRERQSFLFKSIVVRRIFDAGSETIIYLIHSREIVEGSAKMSISTVPLYGQQVEWPARAAARGD